MADNRKFKLIINNIGPLTNIDETFYTNSLNTILFATNGSGKTFISRCFKLLSDIQQDNKDTNLKDLISFEETEASFSFDFSDDRKENILNFKISQYKILENNFNSDFILHVFNKEFVDNNVAKNNYAIDSNSITGEILIGSEKIDVTKEESELETLNKNKNDVEQLLKDEIQKTQSVILDLGIRTTLQEFKDITFSNLLVHEKYTGISSEKAKENYACIKNIPERIPEIKDYNYTLDTKLFSEIIAALETEVTLSKIGEDFKQKLLPKTDFIKQGLEIVKRDNTICPFCETPLSDKLSLIDEYNEYFNQEEAKFEDKLQGLLGRLTGFERDIKSCECEYNRIKLAYIEQKKYFPDLEQVNLPDYPDKTKLKEVILNFTNLIKDKRLCKSKTQFDINFEEQKSIIENFLKDLEIIKDFTNNKLEEINKKKHTITEEQKNSRKVICLSSFGELYNKHEENITKFKKLCEEIKNKEQEINDKKAVNKKDKKEIVNKTFKKYLKMFFNDKYIFNEDKQCLLLNKHVIESNASKVLSDGEKNIIGFCYYLAVTHKKINKELDYDNLLFVIDDPISSMDYHYVYQVSDIIRNLYNELKIDKKKYRYIILTHNYEFLNLLMSNNISTLNLMLSQNHLQKLNTKVMIPYKEHLNVIKEASEDIGKITYQTPNSMRHVLETICRFVSPKCELQDFIRNNDILAKNEYLFTAINDLSHGGIREQKPFQEEDIQRGCNTIIEYINEKFSGQLDNLKS